MLGGILFLVALVVYAVYKASKEVNNKDAVNTNKNESFKTRLWKNQLRNGTGSIGETARVISSLMLSVSNKERKSPLTKNEDAKDIFLLIAGMRYEVAKNHNITKGNYLKDLKDWSLYEFKVGMNRGNPLVQDQKYDWNLFCFVIMYLESLNKREGLRSLSNITSTLEVIYEECYLITKNSSRLTKSEFIQRAIIAYETLEEFYKEIDELDKIIGNF